MPAMNLNTSCYAVAVTTSSVNVALTPQDANQASVDITNVSTDAVFAVSGKDAAPTAVFPTSATAPVNGKVIGAGQKVTYTKNVGDNYISFIRAAGTGSVFVSPGTSQN